MKLARDDEASAGGDGRVVTSLGVGMLVVVRDSRANGGGD